jgi:hypothetical protein
MRRRLFACVIVFGSALTANAGEQLTIVVSPKQSFAPTNLTVRVHIPSDEGNRALVVTADSGEYYRSSRVQLDGAAAPRTIAFDFPGLPSGDYEIGGAVVDGAGRLLAAARTHVMVLP